MNLLLVKRLQSGLEVFKWVVVSTIVMQIHGLRRAPKGYAYKLFRMTDYSSCSDETQ